MKDIFKLKIAFGSAVDCYWRWSTVESKWEFIKLNNLMGNSNVYSHTKHWGQHWLLTWFYWDPYSFVWVFLFLVLVFRVLWFGVFWFGLVFIFVDLWVLFGFNFVFVLFYFLNIYIAAFPAAIQLHGDVTFFFFNSKYLVFADTLANRNP